MGITWAIKSTNELKTKTTNMFGRCNRGTDGHMLGGTAQNITLF